MIKIIKKSKEIKTRQKQDKCNKLNYQLLNLDN